ncbi:MAG TPA: hypothetical protein VGE94_17260, partial [Chloroflexota bacterium]
HEPVLDHVLTVLGSGECEQTFRLAALCRSNGAIVAVTSQGYGPLHSSGATMLNLKSVAAVEGFGAETYWFRHGKAPRVSSRAAGDHIQSTKVFVVRLGDGWLEAKRVRPVYVGKLTQSDR